MKNEDYKFMINSYFDGELEREKETVLFTYLSQDEECREYFKSMNLLKTSLEKSIEEFPRELEERIYYSLQKTENKKLSFLFTNNLFSIATYSMAVVLIIISFFFYNESNAYKEKLVETMEHINKQEQIMNVILNNLPAATVTSSYENEVIVTSKL